MIKRKVEEIKDFRAVTLPDYIQEVDKLIKSFVVPIRTKKEWKTRANQKLNIYKPKNKRAKKKKLNVKNPPVALVREMLVNGDRKICEKGYIYLEYNGYKSYLHRLVIIDNNINIPHGHTIHHKDKNKFNNNLDNLIVLSWEEHRKIHAGKEI